MWTCCDKHDIYSHDPGFIFSLFTKFVSLKKKQNNKNFGMDLNVEECSVSSQHTQAEESGGALLFVHPKLAAAS